MQPPKFSHGFVNLIETVYDYLPDRFFLLMDKAARWKSRKVIYPCDLLTVRLILETVHPVSGKLLEIEVEGKDIPDALNKLIALYCSEEYSLDLSYNTQF